MSGWAQSQSEAPIKKEFLVPDSHRIEFQRKQIEENKIENKPENVPENKTEIKAKINAEINEKITSENTPEPQQNENLLKKDVWDQDKPDGGEKRSGASKRREKRNNNKKSGQNKNKTRDREASHIKQFTDQLCPSLHDEFSTFKKPCFATEPQDGKPAKVCKFHHDVEAYMAQKPENITESVLGDTCPNFARTGYCHFGFTCRFLPCAKYVKPIANKNSENPEDPENLESTGMTTKNPETCRESAKASVKGYLNFISGETSKKLRKKQYIFDITKQALQFCKEEQRRIKDKDDPLADYRAEAEPIEKKSKITQLAFPEKKRLDFSEKTYLAPLTTVGNLPFRRVCRNFGVDVTCGEMALGSSLLQGNSNEWALLRKHEDEGLFGVQIASGYPDELGKLCEAITKESDGVDFIDLNMGCPIDGIVKKRCGTGLLRFRDQIIRDTVIPGVYSSQSTPFTCKIRTGYKENKKTAIKTVLSLAQAGVKHVTLHGRSREARYTKHADWEYIEKLAEAVQEMNLEEQDKNEDFVPVQIIGNGDIVSYDDWAKHMEIREKFDCYATCMIGRGALIKPWLFQEIKERRTIDISSGERMDMLKDFCRYGLEHYGSDDSGVARTRRFLLEWLSFLFR